MKQESIRIVRDTYETLGARERSLVERFYAHLFQRAPELRQLFPESMDQQHEKFREMLDFITAGVSDWRTSIGRISSLGRSHRAYGAKPEHYAVLVEALIAALTDELGSSFSPEAKGAWKEVFDSISAVMIEGDAHGVWDSKQGKDPFIPIMGVSISDYARIAFALRSHGSGPVSSAILESVGLDWQTWDVVAFGWEERLRDERVGADVSAAFVEAYQLHASRA